MKQDEPFRISVNEQHSFDLHPAAAKDLDIVAEADGTFHILHQGKSFRAEILELDHEARQFVIMVNGVKFTVNIADRYDRLVQQLGLSVGSSQKANTVKAPMPGLVLNLLVEPGQTVAKGDPLLILEAMKMENVLKAAADGEIKSVQVKQGAAVVKGQVLIEMQ